MFVLKSFETPVLFVGGHLFLSSLFLHTNQYFSVQESMPREKWLKFNFTVQFYASHTSLDAFF